MAGIFKAYDLRGVYPEEINEEIAYKIGRAYVSFLGCKKVVVGYDMRASSPSLFESLSKGITDQGADVVDIGMVATPMLGFAVMNWNAEAGIMISASHNPGKYNAFKLIKNGGKGTLQIHADTGIKQIEELVEKNDFTEPEKKGKVFKESINEEYKRYLLSKFSDIKDLKVVIDYGNGVGSLSSKIFNELKIDLIEMYKKPDATFPNHDANPHDIKNLEEIQEKVKQEKADLGIFYDGDADRSIIIDENGDIIFPDVELGIMALNELESSPEENIYYDLRFTKAVPEILKENGANPIMLKVGNPFYKEALIEKGGILAAELSGHIMFKDHYCIDDGAFAALKFMQIMNKTRKKASELAKPFEKYFHTEEINMKVKDADETFRKVEENYSDADIVRIDGLLIQYGDWWFSLRKSNTEPLVRLRLEANTKELREEKREEVLKIIKGD